MDAIYSFLKLGNKYKLLINIYYLSLCITHGKGHATHIRIYKYVLLLESKINCKPYFYFSQTKTLQVAQCKGYLERFTKQKSFHSDTYY